MALSSSLSYILFFCICTFASMPLVLSSPFCPHKSSIFLNSLQSQCPLSISSNPPIEVDGDFLDRALTSRQSNSFTSVLFYGAQCTLSQDLRITFNTLSSMFPPIKHLAVEQSLVMPSVFSRYGIHSLPSLLMVNQTSRVRYRGPKNLVSIVRFYKEITGLEPAHFVAEDESIITCEKSIMRSSVRFSINEMLTREPYLVFAVLFLFLRILASIFPAMLSHLKAFWVTYIPHLNLGIFGETSQIFGRLLYMIDVRRVCTKLTLCKTRNFREGARNARVWASSLASVSLGQSSSARS